MAQLLKWVTLLALAIQAAQAAEIFNDPTRPAPAYLTTTTRASEAGVEPLILQSILLSPQRKAAIINGHTVAIGGSIQGYQLQSLGSRSATLRNAKGMITLQLLPSSPIESALARPTKSQGVHP